MTGGVTGTGTETGAGAVVGAPLHPQTTAMDRTSQRRPPIEKGIAPPPGMSRHQTGKYCGRLPGSYTRLNADKHVSERGESMGLRAGSSADSRRRPGCGAGASPARSFTCANRNSTRRSCTDIGTRRSFAPFAVDRHEQVVEIERTHVRGQQFLDSTAGVENGVRSMNGPSITVMAPIHRDSLARRLSRLLPPDIRAPSEQGHA